MNIHDITRPLLAYNGTPDLTTEVKYPVLVSPKLDGIRCLILKGRILSRTFKMIPNKHIRETLESYKLPDGFDGELLTYDDVTGKLDTYNTVQSKVMSAEGKPNFVYHVFDWVQSPNYTQTKFIERYYYLLGFFSSIVGTDTQLSEYKCRAVFQVECKDREEVEAQEAFWLEQGQEGIMLRDPLGKYKCGRSTLREGILLKLKRFSDGEAIIIGMKELMRNDNDATVSRLGLTERSSHQENQYGGNMMGCLIVKDTKTGCEFEIGTGFTEQDRIKFWQMRHTIMAANLHIKYKYQAHGMKDKPRCPVYLGIRDTYID